MGFYKKKTLELATAYSKEYEVIESRLNDVCKWMGGSEGSWKMEERDMQMLDRMCVQEERWVMMFTLLSHTGLVSGILVNNMPVNLVQKLSHLLFV